MSKKSDDKKIFHIAIGILFLMIAYVTVVTVFWISDNDVLKSISEWMILIPMIIVIIGLLICAALMAADVIIRKKEDINSVDKYSIEQRYRVRNAQVSRITIHCEQQFSNERMIRFLTDFNNYTSFNYLIDKDGNVTEIVPEKYGSWSTGSPENDNAAINILCSLHRAKMPEDWDSNIPMKDPFYLTEIVFNSLVNLCSEVVKKYGYKKLLWNADGNYENVPNDAMIITMHKLVNPYGRGQGCVPELVEARFGELASRVTEGVNNDKR